MKLTIGMIVKNEEKWLDRCLSAIKPILDNVDCELIITDTGSTDKTVEIANKYTDKVLNFDWINDFAAARNFGLEKAQGEWFMMLDADDIFRSCDNIIDFFNSGEYRKYNAASYISRNIIKVPGGDSYNDILAPRMVKLQPDTRYENAIHESLNTFAPPFKNLKDVADHYGYYYETEDDKKRKYKRNETLLLKRLEKEKDTTPMLYLQLYETYYSIGEDEKALEYMEAGIRICKKLYSIVLVPLYFYKAGYYYSEKFYEKAIEICNEYFLIDKKIRPYVLNTDGEIFGIKAESLYRLEKYSDAVDTFQKFFEIYSDIENGKIHTYDSYLISNNMCSEISILPLLNDFTECCIKSNKIGIANKIIESFSIEKYSIEEKEIARNAYQIMKVAGDKLPEYYKKLSYYGKKVIADELFYKLQDGEKREESLRALSDIAAMDEKIYYKLLIYKSHISRSDPSIRLRDYVKKYGVNNDVDLFYIALRDKCDLSILLKSNELDLQKCVFLCCRNIVGFYDAAENYSADYLKDDNIIDIAVKFYECCIAVRIMDNKDKTDDEKRQIISKLFRIKNDIIERKKTNQYEFEKLSVAVKKNIRNYILNGDFKSAEKVLCEYQKINPNDSEIKELHIMLENN